MPIVSSSREFSVLAMRTLLLARLRIVLTVPLQAQSQTTAFFELTRQIESVHPKSEKQGDFESGVDIPVPSRRG